MFDFNLKDFSANILFYRVLQRTAISTNIKVRLMVVRVVLMMCTESDAVGVHSQTYHPDLMISLTEQPISLFGHFHLCACNFAALTQPHLHPRLLVRVWLLTFGNPLVKCMEMV